MRNSRFVWMFVGAATTGMLSLAWFATAADAPKTPVAPALQATPTTEWSLPNEKWMQSFQEQVPITFLNRNQDPERWDALKSFWNEGTESAVDPTTGATVERRAVVLKVPLGLTQNPVIPPENPLTVARWALGKELYYDRILSSDGAVACASCHDPRKGFTDQSPTSTGIAGLRGGVSAPTVINSGYHLFQFWDGRSHSLEDQAQGPVGNPVEMFDGDGHAWERAVARVRKQAGYVSRFRAAFGTDPTRDAIAKAIAGYERTVLSGNSVHDRAQLAMLARVEDEGGSNFTITAKDYEKVLRDAVRAKDVASLAPLGLGNAGDAALPAVAQQIENGRALFFGKARCNSCHVGDNFTDNQFHNLGVGVAKDGSIPAGAIGRFGPLPTGHKDPSLVGAFKTPTVRALLETAPYLHDGSEATLEAVVEFYDRGGNANRYLDVKMRDIPAEQEYERSRREGTPYRGPEVRLFGPDQVPIVPLKLNLTPQEKQDLVLFLKALQGEPIDPIVSDPKRFPSGI